MSASTRERPSERTGSAWVVGHRTVDGVVLAHGLTVMGTVGGATVYAAMGASLVVLTLSLDPHHDSSR